MRSEGLVCPGPKWGAAAQSGIWIQIYRSSRRHRWTQEGGEGAGESLQQLVGSDAVWVRVEDWAGAQAVEDQVLAAVEHLLAPRIDVINDLQVPHASTHSTHRSSSSALLACSITCIISCVL